MLVGSIAKSERNEMRRLSRERFLRMR